MKYLCRFAGACALLTTWMLTGCGGGGNSDDPPAPPEESPPPAGATYTVGGTVSGLTSGDVVLGIYESEELTQSQQLATGNGPFVFPKPYADGTPWEMFADARGDEPQRCKGEPSAGTIAGANVQVDVRCQGANRVGGEIIGLEGTGLRIEMMYGIDGLTSGNIETLEADGPYRFSVPLLPGEAYEVVVNTPPESPAQRCRVVNPRGVMGEIDVTNVNVECGTAQIGYTVEGLLGQRIVVALHLESTVNGVTTLLEVERQTRVADSDYHFETMVSRGERYEVRIAEQPDDPAQLCQVDNAAGVLEGDVDDVLVKCPSPLRRWRFDDELTRGKEPPKFPPVRELRHGVVDSYQLMGEGPAIPLGTVSGLDTEELFALYLNGPGAGGYVHSNRTGKTFWVATESPAFLNSGPSYSNVVRLETTWRFRKVSATPRFALEVTALNMLAFDDREGHHAWGRLWTGGELSVQVHHAQGEDFSGVPFFTAQGGMFLKGEASEAGPTFWELIPKLHSDAMQSLWTRDDFGVDISTEQRVAYASLLEDKPIPIDLSEVSVGGEFVVKAVAWVEARNAYSPEGGTAAFLRDPAAFEDGQPPGGMSLALAEGVVMVELGDVAVDDLAFTGPAAPECAAGAPRGTLEFESAQVTVDEGTNYSAGVRVMRSGSLEGLVTARVRVVSGTATIGADYAAGDIDVRFGDGSGEPRDIGLPIVDDDLTEGDETLTLILDEPVGCADIGARDTITVTIRDGDPAPDPVYTLGGTVTGLAGEGLTLTNLSTDDTPIATNGAFSFARTFATGARYEVRVGNQPRDPDQSCTVGNGSGIFENAHVTNITVTCTTVGGGGAGLDPGFGGDGRVSAALPAATDVAVQPDGKVLVVGGNRLARFDAAGEPDLSFGTGGAVTVQFLGGTNDRLNAVAVQPDGHIVVAGWTRDGVNSPTQEEMAVARFDASGAPDAGFGTGGRVITDFESRGDTGYDLLIQPDGAILVTGIATVPDAFGVGDTEFAVVRYTATGVIDTTFGTDGRVTTNVAGRSDLGYAAALQPDGRIVIAGRVAPSGGANPDVGLVRYLADGTLDVSFGSGGVVRDVTADWDEVADLVVQPDGALLAIGHLTSNGETNLLMARYTATGVPDASFDGDGRVQSDVMLTGNALVLLPDGRVIAGGRVNGDFALARFSAAGSLDTGFGTAGLLQVDFFGGADAISAAAIQPDGRVVAAGSITNGSDTTVGLVRITP